MTEPLPDTPPPAAIAHRRLVLSCLSCRTRKVKCDRLDPCQSCCTQGKGDQCKYTTTLVRRNAIKQSDAIKELRVEVEKWKNRALAAELGDQKGLLTSGLEKESPPVKREGSEESTTEDNDWETDIPPTRGSQASKPDEVIQKDGLYFGAPSMSTVVAEFANFHLKPRVSLSIPRTIDVYNNSLQTPFCFPTLWNPLDPLTNIINLLPSLKDALELLRFYHRLAPCIFPILHDEFRDPNDIAQFFQDLSRNSEENPSKLALIFMMLALGLQFGTFYRSGYRWVKASMENSKRLTEIYPSMHSLRYMSFMNRPNDLVVQTMLLMLPYLTNSGRFADAWVLLGPIIRIAQSMGYHRNPELFHPPLTAKESATRQTLWWWIHYQDVQYSMTTGRPLGLSGLGDSPPPKAGDNQPMVFESHILPYTVLLRQILSSNGLSDRQVDSFTDKLLDMHSKLPNSVRFCPRIWLHDDFESVYPQSLLGALHASQIHNLITILNRKKKTVRPKLYSSLVEGDILATGQERVLLSSRTVLNCQDFIHKRTREGMLIWSQNQESFNAAMILGLHLVDHPETERSASDRNLVRSACFRFLEMEQSGLHDLAKVARVNLDWLLAQIDAVAGAREHVRSNLSVAFRPNDIQNQSLMAEAGMMTPDFFTTRGDIRMAPWFGL